MLEVRSLHASYGPVHAVRGLDLSVPAGTVTVLVGPNGAGKTTALRAIMGQHPDATGSVRVDEEPVPLAAPVRASRAGIAIVPQGRHVFASLTVREHLDLAVSRARAGAIRPDDLASFFPTLARRASVRAQSLSGGEQQMLAIARAVLLGPRVVLMDEPTEGLAPAIVHNVMQLIEHLPHRGMTVVLSDQHGGPLVDLANDVRTMERGAILNAAEEVRDGAAV